MNQKLKHMIAWLCKKIPFLRQRALATAPARKSPAKTEKRWLYLSVGFYLCLSVPASYAQQGGLPQAGRPRHEIFTQVLSAYVNQQGLVNYSGVCQDRRLEDYTAYLSQAGWQSWPPEDQLAFWINVYNAFTLQVICENYPIDSINELHRGGLALGTVFKTTIWDKEFFSINGQSMSLGYVEHEILRKGTEKARIHFAIVCAAKSCPPLRAEAYEGYRIDEQLDEQGRAFLGRTELNAFDLQNKTAHLSGIFKWFLKDFGRNKQELLAYLSRYAPAQPVAESLRNNPGQWRIRWKKYDWSLNNSSAD